MTEYVHHPAPQPAAPIAGDTRSFPVHRIFCVGRNYAAHAAEMSNEVDREAPFYFTKSAHALCHSGSTIPYPPGTQDCHFEMEFVVALGTGGADIALDDAMSHVWGYGCGVDLTRRDLQAAAKEKRRPWDIGKDFEHSAILASLVPAAQWGEIGTQRIYLSRDGVIAQDARLSDMVWSVPEIIAHLSRFYTLRAGDLIYTGTPAGVGPVVPGSVLEGGIDGLPPVHLTIAAPAGQR